MQLCPRHVQSFWREKLNRNIQRDNENRKKLRDKGWCVIVLWECELEHSFDNTIVLLLEELENRKEQLNKT